MELTNGRVKIGFALEGASGLILSGRILVFAEPSYYKIILHKIPIEEPMWTISEIRYTSNVACEQALMHCGMSNDEAAMEESTNKASRCTDSLRSLTCLWRLRLCSCRSA